MCIYIYNIYCNCPIEPEQKEEIDNRDYSTVKKHEIGSDRFGGSAT